MYKFRAKIISLVIFPSLFFLTPAAAQTWQSGQEQTTLVELYTSEGCSSCPPADKFMSTFKKDPALWRSIIPVAFHVDYWNYLGWTDRFARSDFSQRQSRYKKFGYSRGVYTPEFIVAGREWRGFFSDRRLPQSNRATVGILKATHSRDRLEVEFQPQAPAKERMNLHIALLGFDISSTIGAGENESRILVHDFVALQYYVLISQYTDGQYHWILENSLGETKVSGKHALVFWVTRTDDPTPIQAVGGML